MNIRLQGWRQGEEIGSGSFGNVYKAQNKATGQIFAVKEARIRDGEEKHYETVQRELEICKGLRHRHIVSCLGHEYNSKNHSLNIFLEYVAGGSLRNMLNEFGGLEGKLLKKATRGILKGLNYLHNHEPPVVHRDLKGSNVLVDLNYCVKLADFGCSKCDVNTQTFTTHGSILWMAPEVLQGGGYGRMADIWSFGCVLIEMMTAADPWSKAKFDNPMQACFAIAASERLPPFPETMCDSARDLLSSCLRRLPGDRPGAVQLLRHELVYDASSRTGSRASTRSDA
jgi:mitogen-activated protein kinase kinase kinase